MKTPEPDSKKQLNVLLVAGETSGDAHGAALLRAVAEVRPFRAFGIGGDDLQRQGMQLVEHQRNLAFMGLGEVLRHLPFIRQVQKKLLQAVQAEKPDLAILIDYPGFNMRLAKQLKRLRIPVVYYISPKFWAWGRWRVKNVKRFVDRMLVLFPFEIDFYKQYGIDVHYVGNPVVDQHFNHVRQEELPIQGDEVLLGILPGSRRQEVTALLQPMLQTARFLKQAGKIKQAEILKVPHLPLELYEQCLESEDTFIRIAEKPMHQALPAYHLALVASGTATLETGYYAVPMVIVYKVSKLTYTVGKRLIQIDKVGLINIVAGKIICPELIQDDFTPQRAAEELQRLLDPAPRAETIQNLMAVREKLGQPGANRWAAHQVLQFCDERGI